MKRLWNVVNGLTAKRDAKAALFLGICVLASSGMGAGLWLLFGRIFLPEVEWLFCFMGYPAVFAGFFGGVLYLYNHSLHKF